MTYINCVPITITKANEVVTTHHRHNKAVRGAKFAIGAEVDGVLVGVAIVGRPVARMLDDGKTVEVVRLCTTPEAPTNTCSFLYARCRRIWQQMGGGSVVTYTLASESGISLRAAGFVEVAKLKPRKYGQGWENREGRVWQPVIGEAKIRWQGQA